MAWPSRCHCRPSSKSNSEPRQQVPPSARWTEDIGCGSVRPSSQSLQACRQNIVQLAHESCCFTCVTGVPFFGGLFPACGSSSRCLSAWCSAMWDREPTRAGSGHVGWETESSGRCSIRQRRFCTRMRRSSQFSRCLPTIAQKESQVAVLAAVEHDATARLSVQGQRDMATAQPVPMDDHSGCRCAQRMAVQEPVDAATRQAAVLGEEHVGTDHPHLQVSRYSLSRTSTCNTYNSQSLARHHRRCRCRASPCHENKASWS